MTVYGGDWFVIPDDSTVYHPTEVYTSAAATRTSTNTDSVIKGWDVVTVDRIVVDSTTTFTGVIEFFMNDETTKLFEVGFDTTAAGNVRSFELGMEINRLKMGQVANAGGFSCSIATDAAVAAIIVVYRKIKATDNLS